MATVAANLYVDTTGMKLVVLQGADGGALPTLNQGDTLDLSIFFLDLVGGEYLIHRYAGASVTARFRAAGNAHVYATGNSDVEIAPASGNPTVTRTQAGSHGVSEIQRVVFPSKPMTGRYTLSWPFVGTGINGGVGPGGVTPALDANALPDSIQAAIRSLPDYVYSYNPPGNVQGSWSQFIFVTGTPLNFTIEFQRGMNAAYTGVVPLTQSDVSALQYAFGWHVSVPLSAADFTDLFLGGNAPAYLEILLTPSGASQFVASQTLITSNSPPPPPPPPPPILPPNAPYDLTGITFDDGGRYAAAEACGDVRIERGVENEALSLVYRQRYVQFRYKWQPQPIGSNSCPANSGARLANEGQLQDIGGGICEWDRVWAIVPPDRYEPCTATKQFQLVRWVLSGNAAIDANIVSWSAAIRAICYYHYFVNGEAPGSYPIPAVQIIPLLISAREVVDNGTGFPANGPGGRFGTNYGVNTVIGYSVEHYMGDIYVKRIITGSS